MDEQGNAYAGGVLTDIQTDLSEQGWETSSVNGGPDSRFARMSVVLPNGQEFVITVEEVI